MTATKRTSSRRAIERLHALFAMETAAILVHTPVQSLWTLCTKMDTVVMANDALQMTKPLVKYMWKLLTKNKSVSSQLVDAYSPYGGSEGLSYSCSMYNYEATIFFLVL